LTIPNVLRPGYKGGMKARHWAAPAIIAWYLLIPPVVTFRAPPGQYLWPNAPLNLWHRVSSFDDADDCENYLFDMKRAYEDPSFRAEVDQRDQQIAHEYGNRGAVVIGVDRLRRWYFARCVASDDARLKPPATR
jgi:hypothetical protein